jgi:predicted kinase
MSGAMPAECVILIGLPASGKSTFYRERFGDTHDQISKDLMRNARAPERRQQQLIAASLDAGRSVVVDNTNPTRTQRAEIIRLAEARGVPVIAYFFDTAAGDALRRNRARQGRERVPEVAIFTVRKRLEPPLKSEGFTDVYLVRLNEQAHTFDVSPYPGET